MTQTDKNIFRDTGNGDLDDPDLTDDERLIGRLIRSVGAIEEENLYVLWDQLIQAYGDAECAIAAFDSGAVELEPVRRH